MALLATDSTLFYQRNDPKDRRLGELLGQAAPNPNVVLIGWPDDRGITANRGRPGAAKGPDEIRKAFYKLTSGFHEGFQKLKFADLGNLKLEESLPNSRTSAAEHIAEAIKEGALPITLGGGNDYAYADLLGLRKGLGEEPKIGVINIDAHLDVRDLKNGPTSGTPYFELLEEKVFRGKDFVEFGIQPHRNSQDHYEYVKNQGARIVTLGEVQDRGAAKVFYQILGGLKQECDVIYVSLDIDSVRQADAPGASAPSPIGLTGEDVERIARLAGSESKVKMFSIYEVSPPFDRDGQTATLAATAVWSFMESRGQL